MLLKVLGVGICTLIVGLIIKQYKPEFLILVNVCGGLIIFMLVIDGAKKIIDELVGMDSMIGVNIDIIKPVFKVVGIGYITEFTSDLAEDCGNKSIANKVVLGGKVAICLLAMPILKTLIDTILSLIS